MRNTLARRSSWLAWLFVPFLVFLLAADLSVTGAAGSDPLTRKGDEKDSKKKSKNKSDDKDAGKKEEKEEPKEPTFEKLTKDAKEVKGLFNVYVKDDEAKYYLEIAPDQLNVTYLLNPTLVSGLGQGFLYPSDMWPEYPVQFQRVGKTIRLIHVNPNFTASDSSTMKQAAAYAAPDAIVSQTKVESQPHPDRKSVLVDMGALFLGDLEGMSLALKFVLQSPYGLDPAGSSFTSLKGYPDNVDFDLILNYKTQEAKERPVYAADPRSLLIRFNYSISKLPGPGFRPRLADDRVGHFLAIMDDYSDESLDTPAVRYVNRWRLEKKDPSAALSEPKQPIVYYLEKTIPPEYRDAVKKGIEGWQVAFEAAGFKNAIIAKDQPSDPDWDAADVRYATIRWIVAPGAGFAQGPSRVNPYTGEIFDADIRFSADLVRGFHQSYVNLTQPTGRALEGATGSQAALFRSLAGFSDMLGPFSVETLLGIQPDPNRWVPPGARPDRSLAAMGYCDFAQGFIHEMALGYNVLQARGMMSKENELEYVNQGLTYITLHEVGHTLGLRHNFKSSSMRSYGQLQEANLTQQGGLVGSVMDYVPVNLAPKGKTQGQFFTSTPGPYDKWAIEYAYKPIQADSPQGEKEELNQIASRVAQPGLAYGTDEDAWAGSPRGMDPMVNMWDLGNDDIAYYRNNAALYHELVASMENHFDEAGTRYQKLRQVYGTAIGQMFPAAVNVPKAIGGISHNRDHMGDPGGRLPYEPAPAAQQRAALKYLDQEIFGPDALEIPPQLLNKLAAEMLPDLEGNVWQRDRNDFPIHNLIMAIQSIPMERLYSPINLARMNDIEARSNGNARMSDIEARSNEKDLFTMAEMFGGIRQAVWSELQSKGNVNSFRRNLQRMHLDKLVELAVDADPGTPEDARTLARADLTSIRKGIDATLAAGKVDAMTRAHLEESKARINAALSASMELELPNS